MITVRPNLLRIDGMFLGFGQTDDFWSQVSRTGNADDCWIWQGERSRSGHGCFRPQYRTGPGRRLWAHRIAYMLSTGQQLGKGLCVRHTCGLACCCNPFHLIAGTPAQNRADYRRHKALEEALSESDRQTIKRCNVSVGTLVRRFGITPGIVWSIRYGKPGARHANLKQAA